MFKRKIGLGKTKLRLDGVDINDDAVQGVLEAKNALGGQFPEHVVSITIHDSSSAENPKEPWDITRGACSRLDDKSKIHIYRGSLIDTAKAPIDLVTEAKLTTLHEVKHATQGYERHQSDSYDNDLSLNEQELQAQYFARDYLMKR